MFLPLAALAIWISYKHECTVPIQTTSLKCPYKVNFPDGANNSTSSPTFLDYKNDPISVSSGTVSL
jgi:hypothetical protein